MNVIKLDPQAVLRYMDQIYALKCRSLRMSFQDGQCENLEETCRQKVNELPGYMEQGKAVLFGAMEGDLMLGFLWAYPRMFFNQSRMFVNGIAVLEAEEGKGIAKKLMTALGEYAAAEGYGGIDLTVAPFNPRAVEFYRHLGFEDERIQMYLPIKAGEV